MKKISGIRKKIEEKSVEATIHTTDGEEKVRFPLLTTGDWADVNDETGIDAWTLLLEVGSEVDPSKTAKMSPEEIDALQRKTAIDVMKKVGPKAQIQMFLCSLRKIDKDVTKEDVDWIITYGMDQAEYMKVVSFLIYGAGAETEGVDLKNELNPADEEANTLM